MCAVDAEHIALALPAQHHLDLAHTVDAVGRHPGEGHARRDGSLDYRSGELGLGRKGHILRHVRRGPAHRVVRPGFRQVKRTVDEGMTLAGDISGKYPDLAVGDLARRAGVLPADPARGLALLEVLPCFRNPVSSTTKTASGSASVSTT